MDGAECLENSLNGWNDGSRTGRGDHEYRQASCGQFDEFGRRLTTVPIDCYHMSLLG